MMAPIGKLSLAVLFFFAVFFVGHAQTKPSYKIQCERVGKTDTVWIAMDMDKKDKPGTLMVVSEMKSQALVDTMYYPILQTSNEFDMVLPHENAWGDLEVKAYFVPKIFQVQGVVKSRKVSDSINAFIFSDNSIIFNRIVSVNAARQFLLPSLVFEKKASVFFNFVNAKRKVKPDLSIRQTPEVNEFSELAFQKTVHFEIPDTARSAAGLYDSASLFKESDPRYKAMSTVTVTAKKKTNLDRYKDTYMSALYRSIMEREFDCLNNEDILSSPDPITFLTSRIPGLQLTMDNAGEQQLTYRREAVNSFYIDEMRVDLQQMSILDVYSIALIKYIPPPSFIGSSNASGGAVLAYTRRGEYMRQGNNEDNWIFAIKGYTPAEYLLFSGRNE